MNEHELEAYSYVLKLAVFMTMMCDELLGWVDD